MLNHSTADRRRRRSPGVECLEGRQLLSVVIAETENNNRSSKADTFAFDADGIAQLQGVSQNRNDKDYFSFTAPASGNLNAVVRSRNGVFAQLEIENRAGVSLTETQPKNGVNAGSVSLTAGQTYFVRLRSPVNAKASYAVDLLLGGSPSTGGGTSNPTPVAIVGESRRDDRVDHANAVTLSAGSVVQLRGNVTRRDRDFFTFTAPQAGSLSIDSRTANGVLAKVELQGATGQTLFETEPNDGINTGTVPLSAGQTFFVRVRSAVNNATSAYLVDLLFNTSDTGSGGGGTGGGGAGGGGSSSDTFAESEPNDTKGAADPFSLGIAGSAHLTGTSANKDDRDFFTFTPTQSGTLNATVGTSNGAFAQLEIEDVASRTLLETEPNHGINTGKAAVTAGQTYFVRLRSTGDAPAAYLVDLLFDGSPGGGGGTGGGGGGGTFGGTFTESEFNGEASSANPFSLNAANPARLKGTSSNKDDRDFFTFTPTQSGTVTVTLASTGGPLANLEAEDAASSNVLNLEDGQTTGSFAVVAGTRYFVRLRAPRDVAASYQVDLTIS